MKLRTLAVSLVALIATQSEVSADSIFAPESFASKVIALEKCGTVVVINSRSSRPGRNMRGRRELKAISFTVTRKGRKKKCKCDVKSMNMCRRCGGKCCHDLGNGTRDCRYEVRKKLCRRFF
uniref:Uncharacterized protein n=1 Tax=Odontella aurita TaxID=265563 RepID=A0A7S4J9H8_9STRA|mmetsp:Transcript_42049/g.127527  ORF Transcript_42049/g.127527 Transcript_42049/m.127527 type:complete len:122 (+) Transcript_42049:234-599(+)